MFKNIGILKLQWERAAARYLLYHHEKQKLSTFVYEVLMKRQGEATQEKDFSLDTILSGTALVILVIAFTR